MALTREELQAAADRGLTRTQTAAVYGATYDDVRRACTTHGIDLPTPGKARAQRAVTMRRDNPDVDAATVAAILNVDERSIYRYWSAAGLTVPAEERRVIPDDALPAVAAAYTAGASSAVLAATYGVSSTAIDAALGRTGTPRRAPTAPKGLSRDDIVAAHQAGATNADLARRYAVTTGTIAYHLDAAGITRQPRRRTYTSTRPQVVAAVTTDPTLTRAEIAAPLGITTHTVTAHLRTARRRGELPQDPAPA